MPTKKPKGRELTDEQNAANQAKARHRVFIKLDITVQAPARSQPTLSPL
jgi:hypothetical protein